MGVWSKPWKSKHGNRPAAVGRIPFSEERQSGRPAQKRPCDPKTVKFLDGTESLTGEIFGTVSLAETFVAGSTGILPWSRVSDHQM